ncbi:MAG: hypothetical protein QXG65_04480 [Thermoplasmata archaeon]
MSSTPRGGGGQAIAAGLITAVLLAAAAIFFVGLYLLLPAADHAPAFLWIGILSILFAIVSYTMGAFSRRPVYQRATGWGFYGFGFAILLLTLGLNPGTYLTLADQVVGLVLTLVILAGSFAAIAWRYRSSEEPPAREAAREQWRNRRPMSAFDYPTAQSPSAPVTPPAPPEAGRSPPSSGGGH